VCVCVCVCARARARACACVWVCVIFAFAIEPISFLDANAARATVVKKKHTGREKKRGGEKEESPGV